MNEIEDKNRQIIPRLNRFRVLRFFEGPETSMGASVPANMVATRDLLLEREAEWLVRQDRFAAADLVAASIQVDERSSPLLKNATDFLRASGLSNPFIRELVEQFEQGEPIGKEPHLENNLDWHRKKVREMKGRIAIYPRNPILWIDLAYIYTVLGLNLKAKRCVQVATTIGRENSFVLRSAARFYCHIRENERALALLRSTQIGKVDPRVLATEISISEHAKLPSKRLNQARSALDSDLSAFVLCELNGAMGTLEWQHGNNKEARRFFRKAIEAPNENTLAQAEWISARLGLSLDRVALNALALSEADTRRHVREGRFEEGLTTAANWILFQPFSARAHIQASSIAMVALNDPGRAIQILKSAPESASKGHFMFQNNLVCALASTGDIKGAEEGLKTLRIMRGAEEFIGYILANEGLIHFKNNEPEKGMEKYTAAIRGFKANGESVSVAAATMFAARECLSVDKEAGFKLLDQAEKLASDLHLTDLVSFAKHIRMDMLKRQPVKDQVAKMLPDILAGLI